MYNNFLNHTIWKLYPDVYMVINICGNKLENLRKLAFMNMWNFSQRISEKRGNLKAIFDIYYLDIHAFMS